MRLGLLELVEHLEHHIRIANLREGTVDLAQSFAVAAQASAAVLLDQVADGARLLDARSRLVDGLLVRWLRLPELLAGRAQLFAREPTESPRNRLIRA